MWQCRKCGRPVFFAERKQSLGFDWHPTCLRCEECGKRLNPGQHAEHKGVPYCHHPCYGALFGPQLFGHGTRNECHTSFGKVENRDGQVKRSHLEGSLKVYNQFYEGKPGEIKSREVNGRMILEGVLKIYWGVRNVIHLKEEDDQRTFAIRRRSTASVSSSSNTTTTSSSSAAAAPSDDFYTDSDEESTLWCDDTQINGCSTPTTPTPTTPCHTTHSPTTHFPTTPSHTTPQSPQSPKRHPDTPTITRRTRGEDKEEKEEQEEEEEEEEEEEDNKWSDTHNTGTLKSAITTTTTTTTPTTTLDNHTDSTTTSTTATTNNNNTEKVTNVLSKNGNEGEEGGAGEKGLGGGAGGEKLRGEAGGRQEERCAATEEREKGEGLGGGGGGRQEERSSTAATAAAAATTPVRRAATKTGSSAIRRRPGRRMDKTKLKRRCSINGHYYLRETSTFTPPHGSPCSVWITSLVTVEEVLNMLLDKYRVEMSYRNFALFVIKDNGERRRIREEEYPLITRVMLGPHEEVARVFIVDTHHTDEISPQVAQFLNLSLAECRAILQQYQQEEARHITAVRQKYADMAFYIQRRMKELRGV